MSKSIKRFTGLVMIMALCLIGQASQAQAATTNVVLKLGQIYTFTHQLNFNSKIVSEHHDYNHTLFKKVSENVQYSNDGKSIKVTLKLKAVSKGKKSPAVGFRARDKNRVNKEYNWNVTVK